MFKACFHRDLLLMKRHSFTYKTRRAPEMTAVKHSLLYATKISLTCCAMLERNFITEFPPFEHHSGPSFLQGTR